jgi:hypothetical protein
VCPAPPACAPTAAGRVGRTSWTPLWGAAPRGWVPGVGCAATRPMGGAVPKALGARGWRGGSGERAVPSRRPGNGVAGGAAKR